jgi:hypothetical protein
MLDLVPFWSRRVPCHVGLQSSFKIRYVMSYAMSHSTLYNDPQLILYSFKFIDPE